MLTEGKNSDENNTVRRYRADSKNSVLFLIRRVKAESVRDSDISRPNSQSERRRFTVSMRAAREDIIGRRRQQQLSATVS